MAFGFFLNMEKLSLKIANEQLNNMTNDNMEDDLWINEEKIINNMMSGFIIITQLIVFFESYLNTILNNCIEYNGEKLLKTSIDEKLEIIFLYYKKDLSKIKSLHYWEQYSKISKVRNEMIHYKTTFIGDGSMIPDFQIAKINAKDFFTYENMSNAIQQITTLANEIAKELDLTIAYDMDIFSCDGRDGLVNYVYDKKITYVDESRFDEE